MADNTLPDGNLPAGSGQQTEDTPLTERRALLKRAAIGLPVILATVHGRTVWAAPVGSTAGHSAAPSLGH